MIVAVISENPELREKFCSMMGHEISKEDIRFYQAEGSPLYLVEPTAYPDRIQPLLYSLSLADYVVLIVETLTPKVGELIVALDSVKAERGVLVSSAPIPLKGTVLDKYDRVPDMEGAKKKVLSIQPAPGGESFVALAHKSESVKSIGNVMHGSIRSGKLAKADKLFLLPDGKDIEIRSLKADGNDADEAGCGANIEISYKGDLFERGIIVPIRHEFQVENVINGRFMKSPFFKDELKGRIHAYSNLQYVEGMVNENDLTLSAPLAYEKGESILVVDASNQKLRIAGVFRSKW
jgi:selenocysteine-specific translation elongation factor